MWASALKFITSNKKASAIGAVAVVLAGLLGLGIGFWQGVGYGKDTIKAAVNGETAKSLQDAQKGMVHAARKLQDAEDQINKAPPSDDGVLAPVLRHQLERMRLPAD